MNKNYKNMLGVLTIGSACMIMTTIASGSPITGTLSVANCSGGGATVTATTVIWSPPGTVASSGCIDSGIGTSVSYTGGTLLPGDVGNILDLTAGVLPVNDFMTFSGTPLDFMLTGVGPGLANTNCALSPLNTTCSPFAGSPFILTYISANVTGVALGVNGTVTDGSGGTGLWSGSFTTQLNDSGTQIQTIEATPGGSIQSAQSGNFTVSMVSSTPEPSSLAMMLVGAGLIGLAARRNRSTN